MNELKGKEEEDSELQEIESGVPQGTVLGPVPYPIYTSDNFKLEHDTIVTFADDTAIINRIKHFELVWLVQV